MNGTRSSPVLKLAVSFGMLHLLAVNCVASLISYDWAYHGRGGAMASGAIKAQAVGADGYLEGIDSVSLSFRDIETYLWSQPVEMNQISGFWGSLPMIRADGMTEGMNFSFEGEYGGLPLNFLMIDSARNSGLNYSFYEAELSYTGFNGSGHQMEDEGISMDWTLRPTPARVPDAGGMLFLSILGFAPLVALYRVYPAGKRRIP